MRDEVWTILRHFYIKCKCWKFGKTKKYRDECIISKPIKCIKENKQNLMSPREHKNRELKKEYGKGAKKNEILKHKYISHVKYIETKL